MKHLNALNRISGIGPQKLKKLLAFFENAENAWNANIQDLISSGIGEKLAEKVIEERIEINPEEEWYKLTQENITLLTIDNPDYPKLLREIPSAPHIIYTKGKFDFNLAPMIAVVGSRKFTDYGALAAAGLGRDLAKAGITVVSGMAIGIDSIAHRGALEAGGKTVAVLGNSLEDKNIYPRINFNLSRQIIENGTLISDYPLDTPATPQTFPARNRLIAGMTIGTLVIESDIKSGTLITAGLALEYSREVFAVPGSIFSPQSLGTNNLIKNGARVVTCIQDILDELDLTNHKTVTTPLAQKIPETEEEKRILEILSTNPTHIDNIGRLTKLETMAVASTLSMMEIKGWVKNIGGQNYIVI